PFPADQQAVVTVEGIQSALLQAALQTVLQEIGAARVEMHAALLIHQRLQELQFGFGELRLYACCSHAFVSAVPLLFRNRSPPRALRGRCRIWTRRRRARLPASAEVEHF